MNKKIKKKKRKENLVGKIFTAVSSANEKLHSKNLGNNQCLDFCTCNTGTQITYFKSYLRNQICPGDCSHLTMMLVILSSPTGDTLRSRQRNG
jgi:hypothetical protein